MEVGPTVMSSVKRRRALIGFVAIVALLAAACGSDRPQEPAAGGSSSPAQESSFPVTIEADNGSVTIEEEPSAIVSLSPTATEILFAIGAGDQVVAVDDQSDFPEGVPTTDLSGFEPNVEAIADYEPDLVVFSTDPGDLGKSLDKLQIPTLQQLAPDDLDGTFEQIEQLGVATGRTQEAAELSGQMQAEMDDIIGSLSQGSEGLTFYHELDPTYFTATSATFIGQLYAEVGLTNVGDEAPDAASGYVQLAEEYILDADPDLIFLADSECCDQTPETVAKRPGWDQITAVRNGDIVPVGDDVSSRWGPRIVDFMRIVADAVEDAQG
jgi:iron complex transport system substrate-binding protein